MLDSALHSRRVCVVPPKSCATPCQHVEPYLLNVQLERTTRSRRAIAFGDKDASEQHGRWRGSRESDSGPSVVALSAASWRRKCPMHRRRITDPSQSGVLATDSTWNQRECQLGRWCVTHLAGMQAGRRLDSHEGARLPCALQVQSTVSLRNSGATRAISSSWISFLRHLRCWLRASNESPCCTAI